MSIEPFQKWYCAVAKNSKRIGRESLHNGSGTITVKRLMQVASFPKNQDIDPITVCKEFIAALEECHSEWWGARFTGACNKAKQELNLCLRKERLDRAAQNRETSRERRAKIEAGWQELEDDD